MPTTRTIRKVLKAKTTLEGAGVHLHRAIGNGDAPMFDPFLLLDDFRNDIPAHYLKGFPWHPHRGIETITYMLAGNVEHGDSMGNKGVISAGDIQWMTAGSGIIHQEMPKGDREGLMYGFQLWANLPRSHKMMDPRYRGIVSSEVPVAELAGGVNVRVICGKVDGQVGPVRDVVTDPEYLDVSVPAGAEFTHPTARGHTVFAYVIDGKGSFCGVNDPFAYEAEGVNYFDMDRDPFLGNRTLVFFNDGDRIAATGGDEGVRFLLISGRPIGEPVAWYGPIVMNTEEELRVAFDEYRRGTFIKKRK